MRFRKAEHCVNAPSILLLAMFCTSAVAQNGSPFRYDDDLTPYMQDLPNEHFYERLKYIPLGEDPQIYLSFGADLRERVEADDNALLGFRGRESNLYDLHRLLVHADLNVDDVRVFVQLGNHSETGRKPAALPTDIDRTDLQQGFVDYDPAIGNAHGLIRAGRFEMSFDDGALIGLRDGPNVRQVWDGLRASYQNPVGQLDAFVVRPVAVNPGYFDDHDVRGQTLWGLHTQIALAVIAPVEINAFYYDNTMPQVIFSPRPGREHSHTLGGRLSDHEGSWDGSVGAILQGGSFNDQEVRAWSSHADLGWTAESVSWTPRLGARVDVLSGGDNTRGTVHTFNALYPNYAFSTQATIEAPANLIQGGGTLNLHPNRSVMLEYKLEGLWRYSVHDAFYAAPTFALVMPDSSSQRYSGLEQQVQGTWNVNAYVQLAAAYVHFAPSAFLRSSHAISENFGMAQVAFRF